MSERTIHFQLGLFSIVLSLFLYFYGIPKWVDTPANVPDILSPRLWVYVIAIVAFLTGILLLFSSIWSDNSKPEENLDRKAATKRLAIVALVMVIIVSGIPTLGMVWVSMLGIAVFSMVLGHKLAWSKFFTAAILPLVLYLFFSHVVGVTLPQGLFVSLP